MELLSRRKFLELSIKAAATVRVFSMLNARTAFADQSVDCPIYMFHQTTAAPVEQVLRTNAAAGRRPITVARLGEIILGEAEVPDYPVFCMTFDDGYRIQYQQAAPVLEKYGATGTFFVMGTGWQGDRVHTYMTHQQLIDLHYRGFEIASHTVNHDRNLPALRVRNRGAYEGEIFDSKTQLEELIDDEVTSFCYPNGRFDAAMVRDVATAYKVATSTVLGRTQSTNIAYTLRRLRIN